jgi:Asparagine synthase
MPGGCAIWSRGFWGHHDDVRLELSGGLDSRMVLAAVPPERRKRLTAFTIVAEGSRDAHVAGELARRYGMGCELVNVTDLAKLDPAQAHELARALFGAGVEFGRPHATVRREVVDNYIQRRILSA